MKVEKAPGFLRLKARMIEYLVYLSSLKARRVEFDYLRQEIRIFRGRILVRKKTIPLYKLNKIYHRIYADLDSLLLVDDGTRRTGQSSISVIFLDLVGEPNEVIYVENYYGMDTKKVREAIRRVQSIVDEIHLVTERPFAIECEEVGFYIDMGRREILLPGRRVSLSRITLIQAVEAPNGYFAVVVFTKDGDAIVTADGFDRTSFISDTVKLLAQKAQLSFQFVREDLSGKMPEPTIHMDTKLEHTLKEKAARVLKRAFAD